MDAHEIASDSRKPLILLIFSPWHLNWLYNTNNKSAPARCAFVISTTERLANHERRQERSDGGGKERRSQKRHSVAFGREESQKQEAEGQSYAPTHRDHIFGRAMENPPQPKNILGKSKDVFSLFVSTCTDSFHLLNREYSRSMSCKISPMLLIYLSAVASARFHIGNRCSVLY